MESPAEIRVRFVEMVRRAEIDIPLAHAALLVAAETDLESDPGTAQAQLESWSRTLAARMAPEWNNLQRLATLRNLIYEELGFSGDEETYSAAENSLLDRVIERRCGIPLTLAIVLLEIGRACGMPLEGVGFPGHFLVRLAGEPEDLLLDPFDHAKTVTEDDCRRMLQLSSSGEMAYDESFIRSVGTLDMLVRLLHNLKLASLNTGDHTTALACIERRLVLRPETPLELRDQGLMLYRMDRYRPALQSLEAYLRVWYDAPDRAAMERHILAIRMMLVGAKDPDA